MLVIGLNQSRMTTTTLIKNWRATMTLDADDRTISHSYLQNRAIAVGRSSLIAVGVELDMSHAAA